MTFQDELNAAQSSTQQNNIMNSFVQYYVDNEIDKLKQLIVGASPETLDTLQELADALGDDPDAITNLVADLQAEITRAQEREAELQAELDAEEAASAAYDVAQDNRIAILEIVNEINKKELDFITLVGNASPNAGEVGINSLTPTGVQMIVLPKTDANGATVTADDFLQGDRIGLKQNNGSAAIFFVDSAFDLDPHIRIVVDQSSTVLGVAGDQLFEESEAVNAVFEDNSVTRASAAAGFSEASDARDALQVLIDALEARAAAIEADVDQNESDGDAADAALSGRLDVLEADPTTATAVAAVQADVDQNESDADAAIAVERGRIDAILASADADKDTFAEIVTLINSVDTENDNAFAAYVLSNDAAVAAVQSDVDQNEIDGDAADAALSGRLDTLEADPTTQSAVDAKLNIASPAATGTLTVDTNASLKFDSNLTKVENVLRGTGINIGNNIEMNPAAAGGRVEINGDLILDASDLTDAADDTAAAAAGVVVGQIYHNSGALRIRLS